MLGWSCVRPLTAPTLFLALSGCMMPGWYENRHGPTPVLNAALVEQSTTNHNLVLDQFIRRARVSEPRAGSSDWYFVTEAGFNYVDELCDAYLRDLYILDREKDKIKSGLTLIDKTTAAILDATSVSRKAIFIVGQTFGLLGGATDVFAETYLFRISPSSVQRLVVDLRQAYRKGALREAKSFNSISAAYQGVQGYLALCLPPTIEAKVNEVISRTTAVAATSGSIIQVLPVTAPPSTPEKTAEITGVATLLRGDQQVTRTRDPIVPFREGLTPLEQSMDLSTRILIEDSLCITPAQGRFDASTRNALSLFFSATNMRIGPGPLTPREGVLRSRKDRADLTKAMLDFPSCANAGLADAFEVGVFTRFQNLGIRSQLERAIKAARDRGVAAKQPTVANFSASDFEPGIVGKDTRDAVEFLREQFGLPPGSRIDRAFVTRLFASGAR